MLIPAHLNNRFALIDFIGLLWQTVLHQSAQFLFLGTSAGNVFGQVGSAIVVYFGVRQLLEL